MLSIYKYAYSATPPLPLAKTADIDLPEYYFLLYSNKTILGQKNGNETYTSRF